MAKLRAAIRFLLTICFFLLLTLVTQVGGIAYLLVKFMAGKMFDKTARLSFFVKKLCLFLFVYGLISFVIVPPVAKQSGRVQMPYFSNNKFPIRPLNAFYFLLNRNYVTPELYAATMNITRNFSAQNRGTTLLYLDANFPFGNGFPLLPHRSHDDGEKLDLCFLYKNKNGERINNSPNFFGYGACEMPAPGEFNQPEACAKSKYWQYSILHKIMAPFNNPELIFDEKANAKLLRLIASHRSIQKIFIEPHLKTRLGLQASGKIRFHGCAAVRHDDHIHIQL